MLGIRKDGDILKESSFKYYLEDGSEAPEEKGYYYIVNGGYNTWIELIAPFKHEPESSIAHIWSKQVESVRKDMECVFGILKKRFLILKHPMRLRKAKNIEMVFLCCAVLLNMLIEYDGFDEWEDQEEIRDFEETESDIEGDGEEQRMASLHAGRRKEPESCIGATRHELRQLAVLQSENARVLDIEEDEADDMTVPATVKEAYLNRRQMLMMHFKVASDKNEVKWV
jgi:hypothetical protein